ncbi:MAG TPA: energy transducer TonB [Oligoflexus sp.]|uniref:energy transducer TonB n=1 Tax=Oligoflexus sp. TaxID=1971216 RepID=UPI002D7E8B36|nr:energy transducer TonB [Oligoflexus sp.]HET9239134.1 energy transducer TonB [Oligoflexus sp.]
MMHAAKFQISFAALMLLLTGACATKPLLYSMDEPEVAVKSTAWVDLTEGEREGIADKQCVTHLYRCDFDDKGQVTAVEALDLSHAEFKELSEESLRAWKFQPGKAGQCFVDFVYTDDARTRMIILQKAHAEKVASTRAQERMPRPATARKKTRSIKQVTPRFPKEAAIKGTMGVVRLQFDVNAEGIPENIKVIDSKPEREFDREARVALQYWRYKPLAEEPDTERSNIEVAFYFNLEGRLGYDCPLGY